MMPSPPPTYELTPDLPAVAQTSVQPASIVDWLNQRFEHDLFKNGRCQEIQEKHPHLRSWRLYADDSWQQLALVLFPYSQPQWHTLVTECFQREGEWWRRWCTARREDVECDPGVAIPPLWYGLDEVSARAGHIGLGLVIGVQQFEGMPLLVRPYFPWPTIAGRPISMARRDAVRDTLPTANDVANPPHELEWVSVDDKYVISDGESCLPLWWSLANPAISPVLRELLTEDPKIRGKA